MKVGIVVDNDFVNDVRVFKEAAMLREKFDVKVLCFKTEQDLIYETSVDYVALGKRAKNALFAMSSWLPIYKWIWQAGIKKFIAKYSIDVLHVHDLYMAPPAAAAIMSSRRDVKLIVDLHENFPATVSTYNWTKGFFRQMLTQPHLWAKKEKDILEGVDRIITLSNNYKQDLALKYPSLNAMNISVFPNVIDFSRFENFQIDKQQKRDTRVTFLYFGVVAERRGIFETLDIFERALANDPNVLLRIIGPVDKADKANFEDYLKRESLKNGVEYVPWIPLEELLTELDRVDVCLAPFHINEQHNSGVANKIFQYMYAGKPLIVSACTPQMELVLKARCGLVFSEKEDYLKHILEIARNTSARIAMGRRGKEYLHTHFDSENHTDNLYEVYRSLASCNGSNSKTNLKV